MFAKSSRYCKLPAPVVADPHGRALQSVDSRPLPEVTGTFLHTLVQGDRVDNLAYTYYRQPRKWWRICDANPEFMSPLSLLGQEPIITARFPLALKPLDRLAPAQLPWDKLYCTLAGMTGVETIALLEQVTLEPQPPSGDTVNGNDLVAERLEWAVLVTFNRMNVAVEQLETAINSVPGLQAGHLELIGRAGKQIVIPPNAAG